MDTTDLVLQAKNGDQRAITELYNLSYKPAYAVAFKMTGNEDDAFDILQDAYIKAFSSLDQLSDPSGFIPWFNKITANKCRDFLRGKKNVVLFSDMTYDGDEDSIELEFKDESTSFQPEERADYSDTKRLVAEMLDNLPAEQKMVLLMYYVQEMPIKEIAEALEISENTVKSRMNYGKKKMRAQAEDMEKKGYKLRVSSITVIPFLIWMLRDFAGNVVLQPMSAAIGTAATAAAGTAAGVAAGTTAGAAAGTAAGATAGTAAGATAGAAAGTTTGAAVGAAVSAKAVALIAAGAIAAIAGSVGFFGYALPAIRGDNWEVTPYSCTYDRGNPPDWQKRDDSKIYFYADPALWQDYEYINMYLYGSSNYGYNGYDLEPWAWGAKKGRMTNEGNNIWSYDIAEKSAQYGYTLYDNASYRIIFSTDTGEQAFDLVIGNDCYGDMAYLTGGSLENPVDSDKTVNIAEWVNADPAVYATPVTITSTGNIIGEVPPKGETLYSMYCDFLDRGFNSYYESNGKTAKQNADDLAKKLGLTKEDRDRAFKDECITEQNGELVRHVMSLEEVQDHLDELLEIERSYCTGYMGGNNDFLQLTYEDGYLVAYGYSHDEEAYAGFTSPGFTCYNTPLMREDGTVFISEYNTFCEETEGYAVLWQSDDFDKYSYLFNHDNGVVDDYGVYYEYAVPND